MPAMPTVTPAPEDSRLGTVPRHLIVFATMAVSVHVFALGLV